jgi:hypothetical protein
VIRQLLVGVARVTWGAAILVLMFGAGLCYLTYRILRFVTRGDKPYPVRDASFGLLVSAAILAKAVKAEQDRRPHYHEED